VRDTRPLLRGRSFVATMARELCQHSPISPRGFWAAVVCLRIKHGCYIPEDWPRHCSYVDPESTIPPTIERQPHVLEWVLSDNCCRAPEQWPASMLGAFRYRLIPSPFEYGRIALRAHVPYVSGDQAYIDYVSLKLYCYGMPLACISTHFKIEEHRVAEGMYRAMSRMYDKPPFVVWATATDFRKARILPQMWHACKDSSPGGRGKFLKTLQTDIFAFRAATLSSWVNSPLIMSYLIHSTPKQPRDGVYLYDQYLGSTHR